MGIVEEKLQQLDQGAFNIPQPDLIARKANRFRQKGRPAEPRGDDFELAEGYIPTDFLRHDLKVDGARHIIFATSNQLELLQQARRWYVDGTFKVLRTKNTFNQLFSIHAFVKKDGETKQVPLTYVFMSRRRKKDYKKVLTKVKSLFQSPPEVQSVVMDFELAVWQAVQKVFPTVTVNGCAFHWTQAVWRKEQEYGLSVQYQEDPGTHKVIRKLLALPLLPAEHIPTALTDLRRKAGEHARLADLFSYVHQIWIEGQWKPEDWSVYGQSVRTNNDCEGWHRRLNFISTGPPPFYLLVDQLHKEAKFVEIQVKLVSERKLKKLQRKAHRTTQSRIFKEWDEYSKGNVSVDKLLRKLSHVYGVNV